MGPGFCAVGLGAGVGFGLARGWVFTIGAGGGSIARLRDGALLVGPQSAGGPPRPAGDAPGGGGPRPHDDWKSLGRRIDQALYRAKHAGRDQVMEAETSLRLRRD